MRSLLVLVLVSVFGLGCASRQINSCLEVRGALDIGSGSTKAFAAEYDKCEQKIVKPLLDQKIAIGFGEQRERSGNNQIPIEFAREQAPKIASVAEQMKKLGAITIIAVATAAFRDAGNGQQVAEVLSGAIGAPVRVISQKEEAEIGARSAFRAAQVPVTERANTAVWDIGGGSMQILHQSGAETTLFQGSLASVTFKNRVIRELKKRDPAKVSTPNPLGKAADRAVLLAEKHARENVPQSLREQAPKYRWLGLGGVLAMSVQRQVNPDAHEFTAEQIAKALEQRKLLTDDQINSEYRTTEVTNLALVLGYMRALKIDRVRTVEASLVQGL